MYCVWRYCVWRYCVWRLLTVVLRVVMRVVPVENFAFGEYCMGDKLTVLSVNNRSIFLLPSLFPSKRFKPPAPAGRSFSLSRNHRSLPRTVGTAACAHGNLRFRDVSVYEPRKPLSGPHLHLERPTHFQHHFRAPHPQARHMWGPAAPESCRAQIEKSQTKL